MSKIKFLPKLKENFKNNWKSGVSVALVSIPLSLSLAIAAGASPMTGIITAVWAGLVGGIVGGSQFNIIGPAGALTGILIGYSLLYSPAILPFLTIASGLIILIIYFCKLQRYLIFVPSSVVHGFTLGVALTIAFGQLNSALGLNGMSPHESVLANILESMKHFLLINWSALIPFCLSIGLLFIIAKYKPNWPNSIIVAILGILFGYFSIHGFLPFHFQTIGTKYPGLSGNLFVLPHLANLFSNTSFSVLSGFAQIALIVKASSVIAFVAVLETLISAKTADGMTKTKFNQDREVLGVGLANIASGIFGGLPASGVFARTALNVKSGARSSFSQVINAVAVGFISLAFILEFNYLPLSITASILVYAAIRMIAGEHFKRMYRLDKSAFWLALVVATLTFVYDATTGIIVGALASLLIFANKFSQTNFNRAEESEDYAPEDENEKVIIYRFAGALTYFNAQNHVEHISRIISRKPMVLNFRYLHHIDVDGYEALDEIVEILEHRHQEIYLTGVKPERRNVLNTHPWFIRLVAEKKLYVSNDKLMASLA